MLRMLPFLVVIFLLASCGKETFWNQLADDEAHSYDIGPPQVACSTGRHAFRGLTAYCSGLQDELANNRCAQALRRSIFISAGCPGRFTPYESFHAGK